MAPGSPCRTPKSTESALEQQIKLAELQDLSRGQARCTPKGFSGRTLKTMDSALGLLSKLAQRVHIYMNYYDICKILTFAYFAEYFFLHIFAN